MNKQPLIFHSNSAQETEALGSALGRLLAAGDLITLSGELGEGKTCFVRGIVAGAAPEAADMVASPTFAILNQYPAKTPIMHYDCYRLHGSDDAVELGLLDHLDGTGICLLEWPERIEDILVTDRLAVSFCWLSENQRQIAFSAYGKRNAELLLQLDALHKK